MGKCSFFSPVKHFLSKLKTDIDVTALFAHLLLELVPHIFGAVVLLNVMV